MSADHAACVAERQAMTYNQRLMSLDTWESDYTTDSDSDSESKVGGSGSFSDWTSDSGSDAEHGGKKERTRRVRAGDPENDMIDQELADSYSMSLTRFLKRYFKKAFLSGSSNGKHLMSAIWVLLSFLCLVVFAVMGAVHVVFGVMISEDSRLKEQLEESSDAITELTQASQSLTANLEEQLEIQKNAAA